MGHNDHPRTDRDRVRHAGSSLPTNPPEQKRRAARYVASTARNSTDCGLLLAALGLTAQDGMPCTPSTS
jgi:hypothetical protein